MFTIPDGVWCPPCWKLIPEGHYNAQGMQGTCPACGVILVLDGTVEPQRPAPNYPQRGVADRSVKPPSSLKIQESGSTTTLRFGGLFGIGATTLSIGPAEVRAQGGSLSFALPLAAFFGVVPVQVITWLQSPRDGSRIPTASVKWIVRVVSTA